MALCGAASLNLKWLNEWLNHRRPNDIENRLLSRLVPCAKCGNDSTSVLANPWRKRPKRFGSVVKRHRRCGECGTEFITAEFVINHPETPELTEALRRTRFKAP